MVLESKATIDTTGTIIGGSGNFRDDKTILQDAGRAIPLAPFTVMATQQSSLKLVPLTAINPALTSAKMVCGTNGGNLAAWQAVGDGSFKISADGTEHDITALVFTAVVALTDVVGIIQAAVAGKFDVFYDALANVFTFVSLKSGLPASTITVLTAGSAGTDISGAGFLNGLTTVGTVTAATGQASESVPSGIFWGESILAATIVAGDVTNQKLLDGGNMRLDEDKIILENSLTLDSVVVSTGKTIRKHLNDLGIFPTTTYTNGLIAPIA